MINKDRIVPIQKMDLLTMIGTILALHGTSYTVLAASTTEGAFSVTGSGAAGNKLANQPVQTLDFASGVTSGTVYFVPAYDYKGITTTRTAGSNAGSSATRSPEGATSRPRPSKARQLLPAFPAETAFT